MAADSSVAPRRNRRHFRDHGSPPPAPPKILIVLHQEHSSPGKLGQMLTAKGFQLDIRKPRFGDPLPETMDEHAGAIIFGGPMSANDPDDFVKAETDWIGVTLKEGAPFLGVCLGAQMLVKHLGGSGHARIATAAPRSASTGSRRRRRGNSLGEWPEMVYQWHREGFDLPSGTTLLARGDIFENQAFSVNDTAFGIQFHSELTYAMACRWTVRGAERFTLPKAQATGRSTWPAGSATTRRSAPGCGISSTPGSRTTSAA